MSAIERVMKAYASKYDLNSEQAARVRAELSHFVDELMSGKRREPTMLPDMKNRTPSTGASGRRSEAVER
jgi:hypothetical protein